MYVTNLKAEPNACGGQIDLSWKNPPANEFPGFMGVKIVRREGRFPKISTAKDPNGHFIYDGTLVYEGADENFSDIGLHGERVYYYTLYTFDGLNLFSNRASRVSAMATSDYAYGESLYKLMPAIYHRYDTEGELQRFLEIFGPQLDFIRSFAAGARRFFDLEECDGALLPLLAQWIGWQTNYSLDFNSQRNEIRQAPELYKTVGIAANLRAFINRLINWNCQVKEFVHNVFLSNNPEQLYIRETTRQNGIWQPAKPITLDVAYEGKMAAVNAQVGNRENQWLFYHARSNIFLPGTLLKKVVDKDHWHIYFKIHDQYEWLPSCRLTFDGEINKYPAVLQRQEGNFWVFWSAYAEKKGKSVSQIKLNLLAAGLPARPARLQGTQPGPFNFTEGDQFKISVDNGITRVVTFRQEKFRNINDVSATELVSLLNRELPGVKVSTADDSTIILTSMTTGPGSTIILPGSNAAGKMGFTVPVTVTGIDAVPASLMGSHTQLPLLTGTQLVLRVDQGLEKIIKFNGENSVTDIVHTINRVIQGLAIEDNGKIRLTLAGKKDIPFIAVNVDESTAAPALGFGVPLPPGTSSTHNIEPTVFKDENNNIWLFWSSRRSGRWKIWYNCFNAASYSWGIARQLTHGFSADREPAVVFDPGTGGKIRVFWARKKSIGLWNIFYRTTTNLNFNTHTDTDWTEQELLDDNNSEPDFQRKEPTAILRDSNYIDLYFSSDRTGSWNIWQKTFEKTSTNWTNGESVTSGHFTKKSPAILQDVQGNPRLLFRTNESIDYPSKLYIGTTTIDSRYSGSTTIDVKNRERIGGHGMLEDILQYVYDTSRENEDWYARDTIGLYLTPDTEDQQLITKNRELVKGILDRFLPIHLRVVFIINPPVYPEKVYTYDFPEDENQRLINEQFFDSNITEIYPGVSEVYEDRVPEWIWIHSQDAKDKQKYQDHRTVDFDASTIDTNHRTWHLGIKNEKKQ
jgi:phage tail-like protein